MQRRFFVLLTLFPVVHLCVFPRSTINLYLRGSTYQLQIVVASHKP